MSLNSTPSGERLHLAFFGRRNAGKSSVVNAVTGQKLAIVSDVLGTTTDPVSKAMELLPLGPVVIIDTPGIDDEGEGVVAVSAATKQLMHDYEYGNISTDEFLTTLQEYCFEGTTIEQIRAAWLSMLDTLPQERLDYIASLRKQGYRTILLSNSNALHWDPIWEQYRLGGAKVEAEKTIYVDDLEKNRKAGELFAGWRTVPSIEELKPLIP